MENATIFEIFLENYALRMHELAIKNKDFDLAAKAVQTVLEAYYEHKDNKSTDRQSQRAIMTKSITSRKKKC